MMFTASVRPLCLFLMAVSVVIDEASGPSQPFNSLFIGLKNSCSSEELSLLCEAGVWYDHFILQWCLSVLASMPILVLLPLQPR